MTPEERFDAHEQWLLDHDKAITRHEAEMAEIRAILLRVAELLERMSGRPDEGEPPA